MGLGSSPHPRSKGKQREARVRAFATPIYAQHGRPGPLSRLRWGGVVPGTRKEAESCWLVCDLQTDFKSEDPFAWISSHVVMFVYGAIELVIGKNRVNA